MSNDKNLPNNAENDASGDNTKDKEQEIKGSVQIDPNTITEAQDSQNLGAAMLLTENTKE
jgi:hypothetical protein